MLSAKHTTIRYLARLMGRMSAATQAVLPAPLFYRRLQCLKNTAFKRNQSYDAKLTLDLAARQDLHWWLSEVTRWNGKTNASRPNSGIGCLNVGVGSQYVGVSDRWLVVLDGEKSPHKCPGNVGRDIRNQDLCQGPLEHTHPSQDGQHLNSGICESHGRDTMSHTVGCCQGSVDMVPR